MRSNKIEAVKRKSKEKWKASRMKRHKKNQIQKVEYEILRVKARERENRR